ncbi:uncharacterized protein LOC131855315 [Achroia grisella]|uniref:uncharacterized protein LOC131855315 n=1 Tax=Achroia grisella TaxID=688607 RepID=UPI0027D3396B|nr:uncharacterized protein LOC131855315 [Achroia grisella]
MPKPRKLNESPTRTDKSKGSKNELTSKSDQNVIVMKNLNSGDDTGKISPRVRRNMERVEMLARPTARRLRSLWDEKCAILPPERRDKIKSALEEDYFLSPEQTEQYFQALAESSKKWSGPGGMVSRKEQMDKARELRQRQKWLVNFSAQESQSHPVHIQAASPALWSPSLTASPSGSRMLSIERMPSSPKSANLRMSIYVWMLKNHSFVNNNTVQFTIVGNWHPSCCVAWLWPPQLRSWSSPLVWCQEWSRLLVSSPPAWSPLVSWDYLDWLLPPGRSLLAQLLSTAWLVFPVLSSSPLEWSALL